MVEKMSRGERAKQFMPFSPLKGYGDLVKNQARVYTEKTELSEEDAINLGKTLSLLKKRDMVKVTYYDVDSYLTIEGMISQIDIVLKNLTVINTKIKFEDIKNITVI